MVSELLVSFGKAILDYFCSNFDEKTEFRLSIDDYTFAECARIAQVDEAELFQALQKQETLYEDNPLIALAIGAYQVKIGGDIATLQETGTDSYYEKIREYYPQYKAQSVQDIMNNYFRERQDKLWSSIQTLFKKHNRNILIPQERGGPYRYVRYPYEARELTNTELLRWADIFIEKNIAPNQPDMSYDSFCNRLDNKLHLAFQNNLTKSIKHTIFNFYKIWDGRSYNEILNRKPRRPYTKNDTDATTSGHISVKIDDNTPLFSDTESGEPVTDIHRIQRICFLESNKAYLIRYEGDDVYTVQHGEIEEGSRCAVLSSRQILNSEELSCEKYNNITNSFETRLTGHENEQTTDGEQAIRIYVYEFIAEDTLCKELGLAIKPLTIPVRCLGGLKKRNGHYYSFCLPVFEFDFNNEQLGDKPPQAKQKEVRLDYQAVRLDNNRLDLNKPVPLVNNSLTPDTILIKPGEHTIDWNRNYPPIKITIDSADELRYDGEISCMAPACCGWEYTTEYIKPVVQQTENTDSQKIIQGFSINFEWDKIDSSSQPEYMQRNFRNQNRFYPETIQKLLQRGIQ